MRYCVDDGIMIEVYWWPDSRRCRRAVQSLAYDHVRLLGESRASELPFLSASKITNWDTILEVLGWIVDTETLTVTLPPLKRGKLHKLLMAWSPCKSSASMNQVLQLVDLFRNVSFAIRPGSHFVQRMLASVRMPHIGPGADHCVPDGQTWAACRPQARVSRGR